MQESPVCRGCLAVSGKFTSVHEFSTAQAYENLIGIPLLPSDRFPQHVCSFCLRMLHRFVEFRARCHKVLEVLHHAQVQGAIVTKEYTCSLTASYPSLKPTYVKTKTVKLDVVAPRKPTRGLVKDKSSKKETEVDSTVLNDFKVVKKEILSDSELENEDTDRHYEVEVVKKERLSDSEIEHDDTNIHYEDMNEPTPKSKKRKVEIEIVGTTVLNEFEVVKKEILSDSEIENDDTGIFYEGFDNEAKSEDDEIKGEPEIFIKSEVPNKKAKKDKKEAPKRKILTDKIRKKKTKKKITKSDRQIVIDYAKSTGFDIAFLTRSEQIQEIEQKKQEAEGPNCSQCGKRFDATSALERHLKNYHIFKPDCFMCDICSCVFRNKRTLRSHLTNHSWVFTCQTCNFKTKQRPVLRKHQQFHEGTRYPCEHCDKVFDKTTTYFSHVRLRHASEQSYCELCGKFFISDKGVENHKKLTHSRVLEEFPSECKDCDRRFKSVAALDRHTTVKGCSLPSCVQCGDSFSNEYFLKYHLVQRHFDNAVPKAFQCDRCQIRFYNHTALMRHDCGNKLTCVQCGDSFDSEQALIDHMSVKHDIFKCEECGKQFTNAAYFKKHYSLVHSGRKSAKKPRRRQLK